MKNFTLLVFALLLSTSSFSQGVDLGIKGGATFANLTNVTDGSTKTGFVGGAFVTIKFSDKIAIQGDLLYSQQGVELDVDKINLDYINFPLVLKYYIIKRINIQAGPQFGTVINDSLGGFLGSNIDFNSFDVTGVVGIGVDLPLNFRITGRYGFGLSDISFSDNDSSIDTDSKNSVFSLTAGFSFL
mgnify:FL=1|tara:strand:+ start:893 stop:1450 length:558 start_codon:yes stop_codon:yes gene_type:complete